jgi:hypothetical protein
MPYAAQDASPNRPQVFCAHELVQIARGADNLPGGWIVDPVADIRRISAPRVWVRPASENSLVISFGFSKRGGVIRVLVRHHDEPDHIVRDEIQCGDLSAAFSKLQVLVMILLN